MNRIPAAARVFCAVVLTSCVLDKAPTSAEGSKLHPHGPPPATVSTDCTLSGTTLPIRDPSSQFDCRNLPASTTVDATSAQFLIFDPENNLGDGFYFPAVLVGGGNNIVWSSGEILGQYTPSTYYDSDRENGTFVPGMHDKYGMLPGHDGTATGIQIQNVTIFDYGDGISFDHADAMGWTIRGVHIKYSRDDCVEDDAYQSGTIDDSFLDGCYSGVSSRGCDDLSDPQCHPFLFDGSNNLITMKNSLVRLQSMDVVYKSNPDKSDGNKKGPNHNAFWKWNITHGPKLALNDNVFRADGPSEAHDNLSDYIELPASKSAGCSGNVLDWFGDPNAPPAMTSCFTVYTLNTTPTASEHWNNAVADWQTRHPNSFSDVAPPIVSIFPPPQYWVPPTYTGPVTLIATAVDDRAVTSVQFQLKDGQNNVQNIGPPLTQDGISGDATSANGWTGPTKYRLSWNSATVGNGTYTLLARARDAAGHETASAGVPVTISNPLTVTMTGKSTVQPNVVCSYHAVATGGTPPYTYNWWRSTMSLGTEEWLDLNTGSFSGNLHVDIQDAVGGSASAVNYLTVSSSAPACTF